MIHSESHTASVPMLNLSAAVTVSPRMGLGGCTGIHAHGTGLGAARHPVVKRGDVRSFVLILTGNNGDGPQEVKKI
jgi:hypothetical protein